MKTEVTYANGAGHFKAEAVFKLDLKQPTGLFGTNADTFFLTGDFIFKGDGAFTFTRIAKDGKDNENATPGKYCVSADGNSIKLTFSSGKEETLSVDFKTGIITQTVPTPVGDGKLYYNA